MSRFLTFAAAGALATCIGATGWSQDSQSGGAGTAGASGGAGAAAATGQASAGANTGATVQPGTGQLQTGGNVPGQGQLGSAPFPNNDYNFTGPRQIPFFTDPAVRRQLALNQNQFNRLNQAHQDAFMQFNQGVGRLGSNLTPQQRMQQMQLLENQFNQQFGQTLDTTFTDPRFRTRFNQLNWQFQPFDAFREPMVRQQLQLTPQQQRQMRTLAAQWRQQMQRMRRAGNDIDPTLADEQFAQMQAQFQQQMDQLLTPQQRQSWNQLIGERFTFPRTAFFPQNTAGTADRGTPPGTPGVSTQSAGQNTVR
jgi:hypothetical protein